MPRVPSSAAAYVGSRIKAARLQAQLTHDKLAASTEIDSSNIRSYESGRAMPSIHTLLRLADALGTDPSTLIDGLTLAHFDGGVRSHGANR